MLIKNHHWLCTDVHIGLIRLSNLEPDDVMLHTKLWPVLCASLSEHANAGNGALAQIFRQVSRHQNDQPFNHGSSTWRRPEWSLCSLMQQSADTFQHVIGDLFIWCRGCGVRVCVPDTVKYRWPYAITFTVVTHIILCTVAKFWQSCQVSL